MPVTRPTVAQVRALADDLGFTLSDADAQSFLGLMAGSFAAYDAVAAMPDHVPAVRYPRTPGYRPEGAENRYNAWYVKTTVKGTQTGKLAGKTIVLKDNVCLAGVPMMNGASTLEGYVPDVDATIVTRMLDAGGTIVGKAHCEYFCFSGGSHTCAAGPVHNPRKPGYSAGGSSSGSAALVAAGEVDMAIGGDQGGSIRIPASYCGIYGMKPTHGLVPYTGIMPIELTLDHAGPMTATVADNALLLEVLAGADGLDPRQVRAEDRALHRGARAGRRRPPDRPRQGRLRTSQLGEGRRRQSAERRRRLRQARGQGRRSLRADPRDGAGHLVADRARGRHRADDEGQRLRHELAGPLRHEPDRRPLGLAPPRRRALRHAQAVDAAPPLLRQAPSRPLLRQGTESEP